MKTNRTGEDKTTRGSFHMIEPFSECWECFSGHVEEKTEGERGVTYGIRPFPGEPWFTLPESGGFSRTSLFPQDNSSVYLAARRDITNPGMDTFFSSDPKYFPENFLAKGKEDTSEVSKKKRELMTLIEKEGPDAEPVFFTEAGTNRLLGLYHPLLPLMKSAGENEEEEFDQCLREIKICAKKERWSGQAVHVLPFPPSLISPAEIRGQEAQGRVIPLFSHDFRFRSLPGVHHYVTHYMPREKTFRVLTGRGLTGGAGGVVENCFEQYWKGEDVFLSLFCDRFMGVKETVLAIRSEIDPPPLSLSPPSSVVFAFLEFCRLHDAGGGKNILDKSAIHRPSGIPQNRPLFPLFAELMGRLIKDDRELHKGEDSRVEGFLIPLLVSLSKYSDMGVHWTEKEWDERDKLCLVLKKRRGEYSPLMSLPPGEFSQYLGLFSPPPGEEAFTQAKRAVSPLESFLSAGKKGEQRTPEDFISIFTLNDVNIRTLLPGTLPVVDVKKRTLAPRDREYSLSLFLFQFAPVVHATLFGDMPEIRELLGDFLTRRNFFLSSFSQIFNQSSDRNFYFPDIIPIPPQSVSRKDIDPGDAMGFLKPAWTMNKFVFEIANSLELSARYSAMPSADTIYGGKNAECKKIKEILFQGLVYPPQGRTAEDSLEWLNYFKTLYEKIAPPVAHRVSKESNLRPVTPCAAETFITELSSIEKELRNTIAFEGMIEGTGSSRWEQNIL